VGWHGKKPKRDDAGMGPRFGSKQVAINNSACTPPHASPTITLNVYRHLFGNSDDRAAEIVEAAFGTTLANENAG
jgi:hypothetical protein